MQDKALEGALLSVLEDEGPMAGTRLKFVKGVNGPLLVVVRKTKDEGVVNILLQKFPRKHNPILLEGMNAMGELPLPDFSATDIASVCTPAAVRQLAPHVKIVVLLRDPLGRAQSRYKEQRALYNLTSDADHHEPISPGSQAILKTVQRDGLGCDASCQHAQKERWIGRMQAPRQRPKLLYHSCFRSFVKTANVRAPRLTCVQR